MNQLKPKTELLATQRVVKEPRVAAEQEVPASTRNFQKAVEILNTTGVLFWLDQGTLLGCIRDRKLIPWDHDIDFGVWKDQVDRESLIANFVNTGFQQEKIPEEMDCVHLVSRTGKKVDITFYEKEGPVATTKWLAPKKGFLRRVIKKLLDCLEEPSTSKSLHRERRLRSLVITIMNGIAYILPEWLRRGLLKQVKPLNLKYPNVEMIKYIIPIEFFTNFRDITFLDVEVKIPIDSEGYLALVYGSDWMIPKRDFVWWQECGALESM
jgi:hypothetical protein